MSFSAVIPLDLLDAATVNGQVVADAIRAAGVRRSRSGDSPASRAAPTSSA